MRYRIYSFLFFVFVAFRLSAISDEALENLVFQSDYVALVRLPNVPINALPSVVENLGTAIYSSSFSPIKVFKSNTIPSFNEYSFIYYGNAVPAEEVYIQNGCCYLFLSCGLPKSLQSRVSLLSQDAQPGALTLLRGGLIPQERLSSRKLSILTRKSEFARHAILGNTKALKRYAKQFVKAFNRNQILNQNSEQSVADWLLSFQGIDGVMSDSCAIHISIWPGWSDTFFWVNTPEGRIEYLLTIQFGTTSRFPLPRIVRNLYKVRHVVSAPGSCDGVLNRCMEYRKNECIDRYNNLIQLRLEEGRLTWSVVDAPLHLDCADDMIRIKLMLVNYSDSAMFVRWPGNQNFGESLFRFYLYFPESRTEIPVYFEPHTLAQVECKGPEEHLLAAGDTVSAWFSLNDPFGMQGSYYSAFSYQIPKNGKDSLAQLKVVYKPYPEAVNDSTCWFPSFDSLTTYSGYRYKTNAAQYDSVLVRGKLMEKNYTYVNQYAQSGFCHGILEVLLDYEKLQLHKDDTIAWKIPLSPEELEGAEFRPPFTFEMMKPGDNIEVWLLNSAKGGKIKFENHQIQLFPTCLRLDTIDILK